MGNLPGSLHVVPLGTVCEECDDRVPATHRVQGETDSFGAETHDLCQAHYEAYKAEAAANPTVGKCAWCPAEQVELGPTRDYTEGMSGPVYWACQACRIKARQDFVDDSREDWRTSQGAYYDDDRC